MSASEITFGFQEYAATNEEGTEDTRHVRFTMAGDNAQYLPAILTKFEDFLRAIGFDYVRMIDNEDGSWTFDKKRPEEYQWKPVKAPEQPQSATNEDLNDDLLPFVEHPACGHLLVGDEVVCISDGHSDAAKVLGMTGSIIAIDKHEKHGQKCLVRFKAHEDGVFVDWWVAPEVLDLRED